MFLGKRALAAIAIALALLCQAGAASAGFVYTITDPNAALAPFPGPYGTVEVTRTDATHATVELTALTKGGFGYLFFDGTTLGLNTNGTVALDGSITGTQPADPFFKGVGTFSLGGAGNVSDFGDFNFTINTFDGPKNGVITMSFGLTNTSGTWANDKDVLVANADGFSVVGHVGVFNDTYSNGGAVMTGFAGDGNLPPPPPPPPPAVPEPASIALALSGLVSIGLFGWRRKRKLQVA